MFKSSKFIASNWVLMLSIFFLLLISFLVLRSIAPSIYPNYLIYILISAIIFFIFSKFDFDVLILFSPHLYVISVVLLIVPLVIGQVTRGAIRWIPLGGLTIQPSEIVRAFLLLFFASYLSNKKLNRERFTKLILFFFVPFLLILIQPSLGVAILTLVGFLGVLLASKIEKKYFLIGFSVFLLTVPGIWFILRPYQRQRIATFLNPEEDPLGGGYNSIQSMISVGSGKLTGRGLGEGVQTQLEFLPEKHTDFVFAALSEEMGFLGAGLVLVCLFTVFMVLIQIVENARGPVARSYVTGVFLVLFVQTLIHIGMNMGLFPITGVPLPFVSAGGSALLGTTLAIAVAMKARK